MIELDFVQDWSDFLQTEMPAFGLQYDPALSAQANTHRYLTAKRRIPHRAPRTVHEARELRVPAAVRSDYAVLKTHIEQGDHLTPYLSRDIEKKKADTNDRLLNAWGIHHLHFRPSGTLDVLFVKFTDSEAFVLNALPHGSGHADTWVDTSLLEILHSNWPEIREGTVTGIAAEALTSNERVALRRVNANFATRMPDGVAYLGDGGLTASGHCWFDIVETDKIFARLASLQTTIESNEPSIREALGISLSQELSIRLMIVAGDWWFYESVTQRRFVLKGRYP